LTLILSCEPDNSLALQDAMTDTFTLMTDTFTADTFTGVCLMWLDEYGLVEVRGEQLVKDNDIIGGVRIGSGK